MATLEYVKPSEFTTGQVLGRANLGVLVDNDNYFNALADRWITIPAGMVTKWESDIGTRIAWDGWHLKRTDMDTLYYWAKIDSDTPVAEPTTLVGWYDYNDDFNDTQMFSISGDDTASGTVDLSAFPDGLYRVTFIMTRDVGWDDATATIRAPFTIYTGALSYTAGDTITDGNVSAATSFNKWRSNDIYFNAITPAQVASAGMYRNRSGIGETEIWTGWDKFHPDHLRMFYLCWFEEEVPADTSEIKIYYDADNDVAVQSTSFSAAGWNQSHWDITDFGYTKAQFYKVKVTLDNTVGTGGRWASMDYLYMTASTLDASYTVMDPFTVDQFVYGSTAAQLTRLDYLTDNDASIRDRLTWGAVNPGRMDFACFEPEFHGYNGTWSYGNYRFRRRGDLLYYRTLGAELVLPDGTTEGLEDYSGSGDYNILDLNTLNLPHGGQYSIRRCSYLTAQQMSYLPVQVTDETLEFAMEI